MNGTASSTRRGRWRGRLLEPSRDLRVERFRGGLRLAPRALEVAERVGGVAAARREPVPPGRSSSGDSVAKRSSAASASSGRSRSIRICARCAARLPASSSASALRRARSPPRSGRAARAARAEAPIPGRKSGLARSVSEIAGERILEPVLLLEHRRVLDGDPGPVGAERRGLGQPLLGGLEIAKAGGDRAPRARASRRAPRSARGSAARSRMKRQAAKGPRSASIARAR